MNYRRWFAAFLALAACRCALLLSACGDGFTKPDADDMHQMGQRIADLPKNVRHQAAFWVAARRAQETICSLPDDFRLGSVECTDPETGDITTPGSITAGDICRCLNSWEFDVSDPSKAKDNIVYYALCAQREASRYDYDCEIHFTAGWAPSDRPDWEPENISDEEILRAILPLSGPPPWLPAGLIAEWAPFICALSTAQDCSGWSDSSSSGASTTGGSP